MNSLYIHVIRYCHIIKTVAHWINIWDWYLNVMINCGSWIEWNWNFLFSNVFCSEWNERNTKSSIVFTRRKYSMNEDDNRGGVWYSIYPVCFKAFNSFIVYSLSELLNCSSFRYRNQSCWRRYRYTATSVLTNNGE